MIKFDVQMTEKILVNFMLYTNYCSAMGVFGIAVGMFALVMGIMNMQAGYAEVALPVLGAALFVLVVGPVSTYMRAKSQMKSPMFQKPLHYEINSKGISVSQDYKRTMNEWEKFKKVVETNKSLVLYITKQRAIIFPKDVLGEKYPEVLKMIRENMPEKKVKVRK